MSAQEIGPAIGAIVKNLRTNQGLTQGDLAYHTRVSPGTISRIENGRLGNWGEVQALLDFLKAEIRLEPKESGNSTTNAEEYPKALGDGELLAAA